MTKPITSPQGSLRKDSAAAAGNAATPAANSATASDRTAEVLRKHREYIWPAVANLYERPLVTDRAHMQRVWDLEGRRYLDFFGGILTISVGHTNPKVTEKIKAQVDRLQHTSTLYPTEAIVN